jgi:hypothetical protein
MAVSNAEAAMSHVSMPHCRQRHAAHFFRQSPRLAHFRWQAESP